MKDIKQELEAMSVGMQSQVPTETLNAFGQSIADLQTKQFGKTSEEGMQFSGVAVLSEDGREISVLDLFQGKRVLVSFVRGSWCPFCNIEMTHLLAYHEELKAMNVEVMVISPMNIEAIKQWKVDMGMSFTIAQDKELKLSKSLGIDFELQDFVQPHYEALGIDVRAINDTEKAELVLPAVYLLDENGIITYRYMDVNYGNRLDLKEVIAKLS
jgi:peroxiredoxin